MPVDWAMTQNNLAAVYSDRIKGDRAENIEKAIAALTAALSVLTREAWPVDWAMTQSNLAVAYKSRIKEDRAQNIEQAIAACTAALTILTREAWPVNWAMTQNTLAVAYKSRIKGDRAQNIEQAIAAYRNALTVRTKETWPIDWAETQNNLANAYRQRVKGDRAQNIEQAITAYRNALTVYTKKALPVDWAMTQHNLAIAYGNRIKEDRAENIENAIAACTAALTVRTKKALPQQWAGTQNNLGLAYGNRIKGDRAENIENAIAAFTAALTVRTKGALPVDWAMTQHNVGLAYSERIEGNRTNNIENAIAAYRNALTFYTREALPQNYAETLFRLGITYQEINQFDLAYNNFKSAIDTVESLREEILSGEESKRKQAEDFNKFYSRMVEVCLQLNKTTEAIEYAERSKTRNLVEQILERDSKTIFPPDVVTQLETYRDEIAVGQYQIQNGKAENPQDLAKRLQQLRQQRNNLQDKYLPVGSGFKFAQFQETLDANTAVIEWYIATDTILTFIIQPHGQQLTSWQSPTAELDALFDWRDEYLKDYYNPEDKNKIQWQKQLETRLNKLAEILHIEEILDHIPEQCQRLILIPHRFLHLFPLHALPAKSSYLIDLFPKGVSYAPSCQILQQVQQRQRPHFQSLFAIQNPTEDLNYTDLEVEAILSYFPSHQVLPKKQATKAALSQAATQLKQANYLHFSCHGSFNFNSPQNSCLFLAESVDENNNFDLTKCLTLGNLFEGTFDFSQTRLVVLSACETGLVDFKNTSDEYISLPSGFLYAGSSSVVSSLWTVDDVSTALLIIEFYQNINAGFTVAIALNQAQIWLRDATTAELQVWASQLKLAPEEAKKIEASLEWFDSDERPFQNPYWWAGFCAIGQ